MPKNQRPIIDIHAHILPNIDDGSRSMEETKTMLALAWKQGIRTMIATPHYNPSKQGKTADKIKQAVSDVQKEASKIDECFQILCGNEVFYMEGVIEDLKNGKALTLAGTSYVLVEFGQNVSAQECYRAARSLTASRYIPIFAHVERYACMRREGVLDELIRLGVLMQMNFDSLNGPVWDRNAAWCKKTLKNGSIHFLGTDMHRSDWRKPQTDKTMAYLERQFGEEETRKLVWNNPEKIIKNQYL